ncbi:MAG TPA: hypothetical protein VLY63_10640 [Anaerolineae bacterium]|nr:hypothetical protein [Anaerolineae bacterium]
MSTTSRVALVCYGISAFVGMLFGVIYLIRPRFMPYHSEAVQSSWTDLDQNMRILILALMRVSGAGLLATGIAVLVLLAIPFRAGEAWSFYAIPLIGLCMSAGSLYATILVKTRTPGSPPVGLASLSLVLILIGFIFSVL